MRFRFVYLLLLGFTACATAKPEAAGPPGIYGRVLGPTGAPIDGVRVTTAPESSAVVTTKGEYLIQEGLTVGTEAKPSSYTILVYKLGWWSGESAVPIEVQYQGARVTVPDIRIYPIGAPPVDLEAPTDGSEPEDRMGSGVVRDGE